MAGDLRAKERAIITLTTAGASLTSGSAGVGNATADLDLRSSGNAADDIESCVFELIAQWATVTGIVAGTIVGELYLLPAADGTNFPDIDLTSGSSRLPSECLFGVFEATKAPTSSTNARFICGISRSLSPLLYRPYMLNRAGQTVAVNWSLKVVTAQAQYT
jgi:hypothetical protein